MRTRRIGLPSLMVWMLPMVGGAVAADVPVKTLMPQPALIDWTGMYFGVTGGVGRRVNEFSYTVTNANVAGGRIGGVRSTGAIVAGHAGYNWQFGRTVTGLEADFSVANQSGNSTLIQSGGGATFSNSVGDSVKYLSTARARIGWLPTDKVLLYGTAGLAWEYYEKSFANGQFPTQFIAVFPNDRFGWVAGLGIEAMLPDPHWIARFEYLHYGFERAEPAQTFVFPGINSVITSGNQSVDVLRAGLSYKFADAGAIAADPRHLKAPSPTRADPWSGFYLGVHAGYGWQQSNFSTQSSDVLPLAYLGGVNGKGWLAGGQAGYNKQYDRIVAGFEIDLSAAGIAGAPATVTFPSVNLANETDTVAYKVEYLGSMRGRLGWLPTESVLLYGTAGPAWERLQRTTTQEARTNGGFPALFTDVQSINKFGWVAGAGIEAMLGRSDWIGRLEYLHYGFGPVETALARSVPVAGLSYSDKRAGQSIDAVRAAVSYKFGNRPAPLQAYAAVPSAIADWTGFYLGGHAGYGWSRDGFTSPISFAPSFAISNMNARGVLGGLHAGHNWQLARLVAGFEVDATATGIKGTSGPLNYGGVVVGSTAEADKINYLGTARARLGWVPVDTIMLYGTSGLAWERVERAYDGTQTAPAVGLSNGRDALDRFGWVAGAGVEATLPASNWVGRLEYLHYDFGKVERVQSYASNDPAIQPYAGSAGRHAIDVIRTGVSYKFKP